MVVCALSDQEIGIDVEKIQNFTESMAKKILTEKEQQILKGYASDQKKQNREFYRFWTLKESYLKWRGRGFSLDPHQVEFAAEGIAKDREGFTECSDPDAAVIQKLVDPEYMVSVCFEKGKQGDVIYEKYKEEAL